MPEINLICSETESLKIYYQKNWLRRFFFPSELAKALSNGTSSPLEIFKLANPRSFHIFSWIFRISLSIFNFFSSDNNQLLFFDEPRVKSWTILHQAGLLEDERAQDIFNMVLLNDAQAIREIIAVSPPRGETGGGLMATADVLIKLHVSDLLNPPNAQAIRHALIVNIDPDAVALALIKLNRCGLLSAPNAQANRDALVTSLCQSPGEVADALIQLDQSDLLSTPDAQANRNILSAHLKPMETAQALIKLNKAGLLSTPDAQANRNALVAHLKPCAVAWALIDLNSVGLLSLPDAQANRDALVGSVCQSPGDIVKALTFSMRYTLRSPDMSADRNAIMGHQKPVDLSEALFILNRAGLLSTSDAQANRNALAAHLYPIETACVLIDLNQAGLLNTPDAQANRNAIVAQKYPRVLAEVLRVLSEADLLSPPHDVQVNFNHIVQNEKILCFGGEMIFDYWFTVPRDFLTPSRWTAIVKICEQYQADPGTGWQAGAMYIARELDKEDYNQNDDPVALGSIVQSTQMTSAADEAPVMGSLPRTLQWTFFQPANAEANAGSGIHETRIRSFIESRSPK